MTSLPAEVDRTTAEHLWQLNRRIQDAEGYVFQAVTDENGAPFWKDTATTIYCAADWPAMPIKVLS